MDHVGENRGNKNLRVRRHPPGVPMSSSRASFSTLYLAHFDFTWRNLRGLGVAPADLDDATQEVFMILLRKQHSLAPEVPVRAWLYGVMRKLASRYHRGRTRRSRLRDAIHDEGGHSPESSAPRRSANPERVYDHLEAADLLDRFLDGLTTGQREVFVLAELEQLSCREIAEMLGANQNTIGSRLRSARRAFDRCFSSIRAEHLRLQDRRPGPLGRTVLSLSRRAHTPTPAQRQRVGALLGIPIVGGPTGVELIAPKAIATTGEAAAGPLTTFVAQLPLRGAILGFSLAGAALVVADVAPLGERPEPAFIADERAVPAARSDRPGAASVAAEDAEGGLETAEQWPEAAAAELAFAGEDPRLRQRGGSSDRAPENDRSASLSALEAALRRGSVERRAAGSSERGTSAGPEPGAAVRAGSADAQAPSDSRDPSDSSDSSDPGAPRDPSDAEIALELDLLSESREALAQGNPAWALAKARAHGRRFPDGVLTNERDSLRVIALCQLGQLDEGRRLADELAGKLREPEIIRQFTAACRPEPAPEDADDGR